MGGRAGGASRWGWTAALVVAMAMALWSCSDDDPVDPGPPAPVITISGVEDGVVYDEAVTIVVSVDVGAFTATLNGQPFQSGGTVSDIGDYVLAVAANNQGATSSETVSFGITLGGDRVLIVRMLDLGASDLDGGGDAILLADSSALGTFYALIDAGPAGEGGADSTAVADRLAELGVERLEFLILTHPLGDHFFGIPPFLDAVDVGVFLYNGQESEDDRYEATLAAIEAVANEAFVVTEPITRDVADPGSPVLTVLDPVQAFLEDPAAEPDELREGSLGVQVEFGDYRLFFAGDGLVEATTRWRNVYPELTVDVGLLKVGHHGGNDAVFNRDDFGSVWLDHTRPNIAFVSANGASHPEDEVVAELETRGIVTYCTNVHGEVAIRANREGQFLVGVERNDGQPCATGTAGAAGGRHVGTIVPSTGERTPAPVR